jgi:hypothetical protein
MQINRIPEYQRNDIIEEIKKDPMSDNDIKYYLPKTKILKYNELPQYTHIDQLLPNEKDACVILAQNANENEGHWVGLLKYPKDGQPFYEYFDSYAYPVDKPTEWISKQDNNNIGIVRPYISDLLRSVNDEDRVIRNDKRFQGKGNDINTCGRHVCFRIISLLKKNMDLQAYKEYMDKLKKMTGDDYDDIISEIIQKT